MTCHVPDCDECYLEDHFPYGPIEPLTCGSCGVRVGRFMAHCNDCIESKRRKWLDELAAHPLSDPSIISRDEYDRLMREAQEAEGVLPTGVARSATFSVCQGVVSKPSKTLKLTLKVQE